MLEPNDNIFEYNNLNVKHYNEHLDGVDKIDFLITIYRTLIHSKKLTLCKVQKLPKNKMLRLLHFRVHIAEEIVIMNKTKKNWTRPFLAIPSDIPK